MQVQIRLTRLSLYEGPIDGTLNPETVIGVRHFQTLKRMRPTGTLAAGTLSALGVPHVGWSHWFRRPWQDRAMSQGFGGEAPRAHTHTQYQKPARYIVVIDSGGSALARLFLDNREQIAEFDAGAEEASRMTAGLVPIVGAQGPEWDRALAGHSAAERSAAHVYALDV
jgi:peptidoglycan hydrolase-like protein with peptidoglycan-binding domain